MPRSPHPPDPIMKTQTLPGFFVAGLSARTNNVHESSGIGKIAEIWGKFMQSNTGGSLTGKIGDEVYAVYSDYESDHSGDYTFLLGFKVSLLNDLPLGITGVEIPGGDYAVVTSAEGPPQQVVPATWFEIWNDKELEEVRSYKADFERYGNQAQVDIYLGIRSRN